MKTDTDKKQDEAQNASAVRDCPDSAGSDSVPMLPFGGVEEKLKPQLQELWRVASMCLDNPTEQSISEFRKLCRPADILLLLRGAAENNREDRKEPFRVF